MTSTIRITAKASLNADLFETDLDAVAEALDLKCAHSVPKPPPSQRGPSVKYAPCLR